MITEFEHNSNKYRFKTPVVIDWNFECGFYSFGFEPLDIYVYGRSKSKAIKSFHAELDFLWREYVLEDESKLAQGAIVLKDKILELVEKLN